jgi:hypothetical protein
MYCGGEQGTVGVGVEGTHHNVNGDSRSTMVVDGVPRYLSKVYENMSKALVGPGK